MSIEYELYDRSDYDRQPDADWLWQTVEKLFDGEWIGGGSDFATYTTEFSIPRALTRQELLDLKALILKEEGVKVELFCEEWKPDAKGQVEGNYTLMEHH